MSLDKDIDITFSIEPATAPSSWGCRTEVNAFCMPCLVSTVEIPWCLVRQLRQAVARMAPARERRGRQP
eukprot:6547756-Pyramimonas_sp.AAC.1